MWTGSATLSWGKPMIDLHTHILPGVDDGAADMEEACLLVRMAWQDGTKALFLTPHYRGDLGDYSAQRLQTVFERLRERVARELPDMQLYLGTEIRFDSDVPEKLLQGQLLTLGGSNFVLLEFGGQALKSQILAGVTETVRYGFTPIIAHADRCKILRTDPALMDAVRQSGGYIQINADSIMGVHGFSAKRFAHKLLKKQKVDFVASDTHDGKERPPFLNKCFLRVCKKYGEEYAAKVFWENARSILRKES